MYQLFTINSLKYWRTENFLDQPQTQFTLYLTWNKWICDTYNSFQILHYMTIRKLFHHFCILKCLFKNIDCRSSEILLYVSQQALSNKCTQRRKINLVKYNHDFEKSLKFAILPQSVSLSDPKMYSILFWTTPFLISN